MSLAPDERRIAAVVLPELACELARAAQPLLVSHPLCVVVSDDAADDDSGAAVLAEVDQAAFARGVRPGMRVSEAMTRSSELRFARVTPRAVAVALAAAADLGLGFGTTVEIGGPDTVWIDVTGVAHLFGGEVALLDAIVAAIAANPGGRPRCVEASIAPGPRTAQAIARFATHRPAIERIVPSGGVRRAIAELPLAALALGPDGSAFFHKLGVLTLGDAMALERTQLGARVEPFVADRGARSAVRELLAWLDGRDERPLVAYEPSAVLVEETSFEDGVETAQQLLFAARGMVSRISSRLVGRRQASLHLEIELRFDRAFIAPARRSAGDGGPSPLASLEVLSIELPAPLSHTEDIFRAVKAKLEGNALAAPVRGLELRASRIVRAPEIQLDIARGRTLDPDALPALLSELSAELGFENVGTLGLGDDLRPERRTRIDAVELTPAPRKSRTSRAAQLPLFSSFDELEPAEPPRLLSEPVLLELEDAQPASRLSAAISRLRAGVTFRVGREPFKVERVHFDRRLDGVAWWTDSTTHRDYVRVLVAFDGATSNVARGERTVAEAWIYLDRRTGQLFLQGWWD
ncbi:MAG: hypothetical protein U0271_45560 [Polyangiaceae bacterium]